MVYSVCLFCFDRLSNMWYCVEHQSHRRERKVCVHICMSCIYIYKVQTSDRVQFGKSCMIHWSTIELMKRRIAAPMHEWRAFPGWFAAPIQGSEADFQSCAWGEVICERSTWIFLPYRSIWRYVCTIFVFICRMANLIPKELLCWKVWRIQVLASMADGRSQGAEPLHVIAKVNPTTCTEMKICEHLWTMQRYYAEMPWLWGHLRFLRVLETP